jgi:polyketide cyclase/dehydrase/lipid transport protein
VRVRVGVTIDAPPAEVWRVVEPIERHVEWMADAVAITFTGMQTRGVGTTFDCLTKVGPFRLVDRMVVTEWTPARTMGIEHRGAVSGRGRFRLRRRPRDRTRFTWSERLRFPWWMGGPVGALAAKPILRAIWRRNLRTLKGLIERRSL